jgi:hypothetical protein
MTFSKPGLTFSVNFSLKTDDPSDLAFRHCRIMERDSARLVRTFTGKIPRSQSTRKQVKSHIARWCELNPARLPMNGAAIVLDLDHDHVWKAQRWEQKSRG